MQLAHYEHQSPLLAPMTEPAGGLHCFSCMSNGDAVRIHNGVRDVYYDYCERGGLRPEREAPHLLQGVLGQHDQQQVWFCQFYAIVEK